MTDTPAPSGEPTPTRLTLSLGFDDAHALLLLLDQATDTPRSVPVLDALRERLLSAMERAGFPARFGPTPTSPRGPVLLGDLLEEAFPGVLKRVPAPFNRDPG